MRLLFVADVHAANGIVRKAVAVANRYEADALLLAGDLCGKTLLPAVKLWSGGYRLGDDRLESEAVLEGAIERLADRGDYVVRCGESELEELQERPEAVAAAFSQAILARLDEWRKYLKETVDPSRLQVLITPGNDDPVEVDEKLRSFREDGILSPVEEIHRLGANELVTLDYTNPTPWSTPREMKEPQLAALIRRRVEGLEDPARAIFNFHCPPLNTRLDLAPELNANFEFVVDPGGQSFVHVGSRAVRDAILEVGPMLGLHGHVHEAAGEERLGRTLCLNPGSEYSAGILRAYLVTSDSAGDLVSHQRVEG